MSILFFLSSRIYSLCGRCDIDPDSTARCKAVRGEWCDRNGSSLGRRERGVNTGARSQTVGRT